MAAVSGATTVMTMGSTATRARVHVRHAADCASIAASHVPSMPAPCGMSQTSPMGHVWVDAIAGAKNLEGFGYGARRSEENST
jgi:hypothetical protein